MEETTTLISNLQQELNYYKKQLTQASGENIRSDYVVSNIRHELKQKKQAFAILTHLQKEFLVTTPLYEVFSKTLREIDNHLSMDRSIIFLPSGSGQYKAAYWSGFPVGQLPLLESTELEFPADFSLSVPYMLVNKQSPPGEFEKLVQEKFGLKYLVGVPMLVDDKCAAFIICSREFETMPFNPPFDKGDADTLSAIASLIASVLQNKKMLDMKLEMQREIEEKNEIVNIFGQQVSKDVALALINPKEEKGSRKTVAVMFLDIRNFTPFVQNKPPEETVRYLNSLFGFMTEIIDQYKGIVNQFLGDGFMTTFGAPVVVDNPFQNAVSAALQIRKVLAQKITAGEIPATRIGIGIHGGEAVTGNIGSNIRKQYTITGNVVIIAARIEQLTKQYQADTLITADIRKNIVLGDHLATSLGDVVLKGMSEPIELFRLD